MSYLCQLQATRSKDKRQQSIIITIKEFQSVNWFLSIKRCIRLLSIFFSITCALSLTNTAIYSFTYKNFNDLLVCFFLLYSGLSNLRTLLGKWFLSANWRCPPFGESYIFDLLWPRERYFKSSEFLACWILTFKTKMDP